MKPLATNTHVSNATRARMKQVRGGPTIQAHGRRDPACRTKACDASHEHGRIFGPGHNNQNLNQAHGGPANGVNQRTVATKQIGSPASKSPNYRIQTPVPLGRGSQQIRATIQGTQIAGSVEIRSAGAGRAYISNLKVDQQHRRRGVAAKLIDAAIASARRQGFRAASLEARPSDNGISPQALVAMYRRQGFKNVGKSSRGSPLMERKL